MALSVIYIILSIALLYYGADRLVKGSSQIGVKLGLSPLVIGLTIVALGTSAPELVVSVNAAISGKGAIAIGNVLGSNILNICIILGITALVSPVKIKLGLLKVDIPALVLSTVLFILLFADRRFTRIEGVALLTVLIGYTVMIVLLARKEKSKEIQDEFSDLVPAKLPSPVISILFILAGLGLLVAGSRLLVTGAVEIARIAGLSETIIGITIVAAGTSLPELAASIVAAAKKEHDIAVGNIIGSNIFNLTGIAGIAAIAKPVSALGVSNIDLYFMLGTTLLLIPFFRTSYTLKRDEAIFMILVYAVYLFYIWPK